MNVIENQLFPRLKHLKKMMMMMNRVIVGLSFNDLSIQFLTKKKTNQGIQNVLTKKKQSRAFKCDLCFKLFLPLRFYVKSFFEIPKVPKTAILTFLEALNIYFEDFLHFWRAEFCQTQISELLKLQK